MIKTLARFGMIAVGLSAYGSAMAQQDPSPSIQKKLQPYIECINRLSERSHSAEERYLSWVNAKTGPTGKERIIYGLYTIYDPKPCAAGVEAAAKIAPNDAELEKAGADYAAAVLALAPVLEEANDYYDQKNYKDDKMAKGREMHPRLMAAFAKFSEADKALRGQVETLNDKAQRERLAEIEKLEGRSQRYWVGELMLRAKVVLRAEQVDPKAFDVAKATAAITELEQAVKEIEKLGVEKPDQKVGSIFLGAAKSYLSTSKELMRRVRDKVPYSQGERMILSSGGGGGWMVEGSPPRLTRDYNQLVEAYNRGAKI
jgi:hypothetical protein